MFISYWRVRDPPKLTRAVEVDHVGAPGHTEDGGLCNSRTVFSCPEVKFVNSVNFLHLQHTIIGYVARQIGEIYELYHPLTNNRMHRR